MLIKWKPAFTLIAGGTSGKTKVFSLIVSAGVFKVQVFIKISEPNFA